MSASDTKKSKLNEIDNSRHSSNSGSSKIYKLLICDNKSVIFGMMQVSKRRRLAEKPKWLSSFLSVGGFMYANKQRPLSWLSTCGGQMLLSRWNVSGEWFGVGMATNAV